MTQHFLMKNILDDMRKRTMANVMQETGDHHQLSFFVRETNFMRYLTTDVTTADRMIKAGMDCARKNKIAHAKLLNMPQSLKQMAIDEWLDPTIFNVGKLHCAMDRVFDYVITIL